MLSRIKKIAKGIEKFPNCTLIVLIIVTGFYAFSTERMADIMEEENRISNRPYLAIESIKTKPDADNKQIIFDFYIKNMGKTPGLITEINIQTLLESAEVDNQIILHPEEIKSVELFRGSEEYIKLHNNYSIKIKYRPFSNLKQKYCIEYNYYYQDVPEKELNIKDIKICD